MKLEDIDDRVKSIKERAGFFMAKRRKDAELYQMLADTMELCETVQREGLEIQFRKRVAAQHPNGRNRVFTEKGSDIYVVVSRAVFEPEINRGTSWRYCSAMREAAKRRIPGCDLASWLADNGGVQTLFEGRGVLAKSVTTKTLHLNAPVTVSKSAVIVLTLKRDRRGYFDVVEQGEKS